jgi:hypothetical protein
MESIDLVDLVPAFRAHGGKRLFADVIHADAEGCRVVADTLRERASWIFQDGGEDAPSSKPH